MAATTPIEAELRARGLAADDEGQLHLVYPAGGLTAENVRWLDQQYRRGFLVASPEDGTLHVEVRA